MRKWTSWIYFHILLWSYVKYIYIKVSQMENIKIWLHDDNILIHYHGLQVFSSDISVFTTVAGAELGRGDGEFIVSIGSGNPE